MDTITTGYCIKTDGTSRGLQPWLQAMNGVTVDIQEHPGPDSRGRIVVGNIVRVDPPFQPDPEVTLVQVDMHGRPIPGGQLTVVRIERIREVAVW